MPKCLFATFLLFYLLTGTSKADAIELKELDRFTARLPISLDYSTATCSLWTSGNSHLVSRVSLQGKRVEARHLGLSGFAFAALYEGKLLAVEFDGSIYELGKDERLFRGRINLSNLSARPKVDEDRITGGAIRSDGTFVVSSTSKPVLKLFEASSRPTNVANMAKRGTYRGVAYDPVNNHTYALFRVKSQNYLVVLDSDFEIVTTRRLAAWGRLAEGIAVQPETGDLFISFMQNKSINGDIVRFSIEGLDDDDVISLRPAYACGTS